MEMLGYHNIHRTQRHRNHRSPNIIEKSSSTSTNLIPVLSLLVALASVISAAIIQNKQINTQLITSELQVKYNEKRIVYAMFLTTAAKSFYEAKQGNKEELLKNILLLYNQFYLMEPLFNDDFIYIYRQLMSSSNIPESFNKNEYYKNCNIPIKFRSKNNDLDKKHPLGALLANLDAIQGDYDTSSEKNRIMIEEYVGNNLDELNEFFTTEVYYKLFVEK